MEDKRNINVFAPCSLDNDLSVVTYIDATSDGHVYASSSGGFSWFKRR